jgi:hypothetical protein
LDNKEKRKQARGQNSIANNYLIQKNGKKPFQMNKVKP